MGANEPLNLDSVSKKRKFRNVNILDTPEYNRVKTNTKNSSDCKYKDASEHRQMAGAYDLRTIRAMEIAKIQSDIDYRQVQTKKQKEDERRRKAINAQEPAQYGQIKQDRG